MICYSWSWWWWWWWFLVCLETGSCYITLAGLEFSKSSRLAWNLWWFCLRRRYTLLIEYAIIVCTNKDADRVELQCRERWTITNTGFYIWFFLNSCMFEEVQKKHTRFHFVKPTEDRLLVSPYIWELWRWGAKGSLAILDFIVKEDGEFSSQKSNVILAYFCLLKIGVFMCLAYIRPS